MAGLHSAKVYVGASRVTLIGVDGDLVKQCQRLLEAHFARKSPAFSEVDENESPEAQGSLKIVSSLATNPGASNRFYPLEIENNAAAFSDDIDKARFSPSPVNQEEFAPIIAEVRSLHPSHLNKTARVAPSRRNGFKTEPTAWDCDNGVVPAADYTCIACGELVPLSGKRDHNRTHGSLLDCRLCGKVLRSMAALLSHLRSHFYTDRRRRLLKQTWKRPPVVQLPPDLNVRKRRNKRINYKTLGPLAATLRSQDAPPLLLPFDADPLPSDSPFTDPLQLEAPLADPLQSDSLSTDSLLPDTVCTDPLQSNAVETAVALPPSKRKRGRPPKQKFRLQDPQKMPNLSLPPQVQPFVSVLSKKTFAAVTSNPKKKLLGALQVNGLAASKLLELEAVSQVDHSNYCKPAFAESDVDEFNLLGIFPPTDSESEGERAKSPEYRPNRQVPKRRLFACDRCPIRCANAYLLRRHTRRHAFANRIECSDCGRLFFTASTLAAHVYKSHPAATEDAEDEETAPLACGACEALLVSKMRLAEHYNTSHINLALLGCGICKEVLSLSQWRTHASKHI